MNFGFEVSILRLPVFFSYGSQTDNKNFTESCQWATVAVAVAMVTKKIHCICCPGNQGAQI